MSPIDRVKALRRLAASTTFPEEAASARAKADELITKYSLREEQLRETPALRPQPPAPAPVPTVYPTPYGYIRVVYTGVVSPFSNTVSRNTYIVWGGPGGTG